MKLDFYTSVHIHKNNVLVRGYRNGKRLSQKVPYKPYLFVPSQTKTEYKTVDGKYVGRVDFDSIWEARQFCRDYKDVDGMTIYGMQNFVYPFIFDHFPGDIEYEPDLINVVSLDIETDAEGSFPDIDLADKEVTLITLGNRGNTITFGYQPYEVQNETETYIQCLDERDLLLRFLDCWNGGKYAPDVITGWNIDFFDVPYLVNRITRILGEDYAKKLSPWELLEQRTVEIMGREHQVFTPVGITALDYQQLYKKFGYSIQESYSLDHIAFVELGQKKLDYSEYGSLAGLQKGNWQLYTEYNIRDVLLVDRLDAKLKLIELVFAMAYDGKFNYQDSFTTVRAWDAIIHNYLLEQNVVIPPVNVPEVGRKIAGGYVKEPQVGLHNWVMSFDLESLYPKIMMGYNISPEMFVGRNPIQYTTEQLLNAQVDSEDLRQRNVTLTANGLNFSREKEGFIPALQRKFFESRKHFKGLMLDAAQRLEEARAKGVNDLDSLISEVTRYDKRQMSRKILINSGFGAFANRFFRWYNLHYAEAITLSGQLTSKWIEKKLNERLNKMFKMDKDWVIAIDTDSCFLNLEVLVNHVFKDDQSDVQKIINYLDKLSKEVLGPYIHECFEELTAQQNMMSNTMYMKRECIGNRAIWRGAKNYIVNVYNNEGVTYSEPKLKMMGIEAIKSSTPQVCRDAIKQSLKHIMNDTEQDLQDYIQKFREHFGTLSFEQVAFPRSVSNLTQYSDAASVYSKGTPLNSKGSLLYNFYLKKYNLQDKYEPIASGQKIKYTYLKLPNPINDKVIAAPNGKLPPEFNLDKYIDYDTQWEKSFLGPIQSITSVMGWETEKRATLDALFG